MKQINWLLATDIDNTLTGGDPQDLKRLAIQIGRLRAQGRLVLFLSTGRTLNQVLTGFEQEYIPAADAIISQVGTEVYVPPFSAGMAPLSIWDSFLQQQFSRERATEFLNGIEGAQLQPARYNTPLKVSYFLDQAPDPPAAAERVRQRVAEAGDGYRVVWSSGKHLDILPANAGKANAIRFLINYFNLLPQKVITAGDSGNDRSMIDTFDYGIIVGNAQPMLKQLQQDPHRATLYFAEQAYAAGVEEGLRHLGVLEE
ncbi:MAG TPA: HAD-IIB family hydrolase [Anaerolineae bacterium]|nr:HAD-IIB family hydrolase [Anaerolineae bacterium]HMR65020.1 HAD-IIB family hydrolase [Anaerolineae bacterium]